MKKFRYFCLTVVIVMAMLLITSCQNPVKTEPDYTSDVASAKSYLWISFANGDDIDRVTQNIPLPVLFNGVNISWASSDSNIISISQPNGIMDNRVGVVTRPPYTQGYRRVTLTANLTKGSATDTKTFYLTVLALEPPTYTVTFDSQGADIFYTSSTTVTEPATTLGYLPTAPQKSGFVFDGWFTEPEGYGTEFTAETYVGEDITVYAKWTVDGPAGYVYVRVTIDPTSDISISKSQRGSLLTLIADENYDSYMWKINGIIKSETTNELLFDKSAMASGTYSIFVKARKGNEYKSAIIYVKVGAE